MPFRLGVGGTLGQIQGSQYLTHLKLYEQNFDQTVFLGPSSNKKKDKKLIICLLVESCFWGKVQMGQDVTIEIKEIMISKDMIGGW